MTYRRAAIAVFLVGLLFLVAMLTATGGRASLPLDDSFIYFQYARQAAAGEFLVYQPGELPTTGTTSLPWMLLLAVGSLLGFGGKAIVFFAMAMGGAFFALAVWRTGQAQRVLAPRKPGSQRPGDLALFGLPLAAALVLLSGPLQWGAWSGMEIALFAAAIANAFHAWSAAEGRPTGRAVGALALLALVRPEGALLAGTAALLWVVSAIFHPDRRRGLGWLGVPLVAALGIPAVFALVTGDPRSSGYVAKSMLSLPGVELGDALRVAGLRAVSLAATLFGGLAPPADGQGLYAYDSETAALFVAPGAGLLFLVGVLPALAREWTDRRAGPGWLALAWIGVLVASTCLLEEPDAHFSRYQMPILPVFLLFVAIGAGRVARVTRESVAGFQRIDLGIRIYLLGFGAFSVLFFAAAFGDNCRDIDRMQIALGESLRATLEPGEIVAINDAGALAYFSGRRTVDLIGLTTPGFAGLWGQGSGVLFEKLEGLPADRRPGWFCIFPNWFDLDGIGFLRRQGSVRLLTPSIVDAEKVLYRADWSLAGGADAPRLPLEAPDDDGWSVVDRLDVADPDSEAAHRFRFEDRGLGGSAGSFVRRAGFVHDPTEIVDGLRTVLGSVSFEVERAPFAPTALVVRSLTGVRQNVWIRVDDAEPEPVEIYAAGPGRFHDQIVAAVAPGSGPARIRISLIDEPAGTAPLVLAHIFVVERPQ